MTANGGVLVIDDFGRQQASPAALLNRWITPLESRIDYLTLQTGQKLPMPFVLLVVFATNISPSDLVDEAFLRRIQYKVFAENPTVAQFKDIFERCCAQHACPTTKSLVDDCWRTCTGRGRSRCAAATRATSSARRCRSATTWASPAPHRRAAEAAFHTYFVDEHGESLVPG